MRNQSKKKSDKSEKENNVASDSSTSNQLNEMGINNPLDITRYSLVRVDNEDILKIYYKRQQGSILPSSRKYKFGRSANTIVTDSGKPGYDEVHVISPYLHNALVELDQIIKKNHDISDHKKIIIDEIDYLEKEVASKLKELRYRVEQLSCK